MSKYTTEVRFICESFAGLDSSVGYTGISDVLAAAVPKIFDFDFPIYDESYRNVLCTKILKHYYTREIGAETYALWKLWLDTRLNEIMPYYNKMYESAAIEYNPVYNVEVTTTKSGSSTETAKRDYMNDSVNTYANNQRNTYDGTVTDKVDNLSAFSDTPQGMLQGVDTLAYLTNATKIEGENSRVDDNERIIEENNTHELHTDGTENNSVNNTDEWVHKVLGKTGNSSYSQLIKEYRNALINVDMMIINELKDLFMNLW